MHFGTEGASALHPQPAVRVRKYLDTMSCIFFPQGLHGTSSRSTASKGET